MDINELFKSCRNGNKTRVEQLVEEREVDLNVRDYWDSTPLYYACLCGHEELVKYLLDNGAMCEANTFDGERCMYGALTDRIRNILKKYEVITSRKMRRDLYEEFLRRLLEGGEYADINFVVHGTVLQAHRAILSTRCTYFQEMFEGKWKDKQMVQLSNELVQIEAFKAILQYIYTGRLECHYDMIGDITLVARQCRLDSLLENLKAKVKDIMQFESTKPGVHVTRICLESKTSSYNLRLDIGYLADLALPMELCNFADIELPFSREATPLFVDLCLSVQGHRFMVHKTFVCGRSDYFKALVSDHFHETDLLKPDTPIMHLNHVTVDVFTCILYYIYQNGCELTEKNIYDVLCMADMYLLPGLKTQCASHITKYVDKDNVINILTMARSFTLPRLEDCCAEFISSNIEEMIDNEEFIEVVQEDARSVQQRQETDSIPIIDDVRYYITNHLQTYSDISEAKQKLELIDSLLEKLGLDA